MKILRKLICLIIGHNYCVLFSEKNQNSAWGVFMCSRCDKEYEWQWDF